MVSPDKKDILVDPTCVPVSQKLLELYHNLFEDFIESSANVDLNGDSCEMGFSLAVAGL